VLKVVSAVVPALLLGSGIADASTSYLTPAADTYVKRTNKGPYGSEPLLAIKNVGGKDNTRKAFIRFEDVDAPDAFEVSLSLTLAQLSNASSTTLRVWGINDSDACGEAFDEATLKYKSSGLTYFNDGDEGIKSSSACIFGDGPLISFTVTTADVGRTLELSSAALQRFVRANRNGRVTFAITKHGNGGDAFIAFASKEHPSLAAPALAWTSSAEPDLSGAEQISTNSDGSTHYRGVLKLPLSGGRYLELPGASVDMTFSESGRLQTIQGTVGFPQLAVSGGLLGKLPLAPTVAGPALQIGFAYGRDLGFTDLPVEDDTPYYYFATQSGVGMTLGPIELASDAFGASQFILDPMAPTLLFYSSQIPGLPPAVGALGIGVSGSNGIPWTAERTTGVAAQMVGFAGDLYLYGELGLPIPARGPVDFEATVSGALTADVNDDLFTSTAAASDPTGWIEQVGANANLDVTASLGAASITHNIAGSSLLYRRHGAHGLPSLTYVGEVDPGKLKLPGFPVSFDGSTAVSAYLDTGAVAASFVQMTGDVKLGAGFGNVKLDGTVRVSSTGLTYSGKAKFGGFDIGVSGAITQSGARLTGDASESVNFKVGKVKLSLEATLDTADRSAKVRTSGKLCVGGSFGIPESCSGVSVSGTVKSSGHIEVCVSGECKTL
jgi:hypothetical protein